MAEARIPAEVFPVGHFIADEMKARGWDVPYLATRMDPNPNNGPVWVLTLELLIECSDDPGITLDVDTAQRLGKAFDTSADLWLNLHRNFQECQVTHPLNSAGKESNG